MRAVCYPRVSSAAQRERETIVAQLRVLPEYVERQGWQLVRPVATYADDGHTARAGKLEARTGLAALLRDAALGLFDVVVMLDLDRLTRSEDITERGALLGAFQRAGVMIATTISGQLHDLGTSGGDLYTAIHGFFGAEWTRKHRERITQGKLTAIQRGRKPAGPTPYGLLYVRATGAWSVDPERGPIVREIYVRVAAGESTAAIARDLDARAIPRPRGRWSGARVYAIVRSRYPVGEWTVDKARGLTLQVPPIVTEAEWQAADRELHLHRRRGLRKTRHVYLLEGLAVCASCGTPMFIRSANPATKLEAAYVCRARKLERACRARIWRVRELDDRVWAAVTRELDDPELAEELARERVAARADVHDWSGDAEGYRAHLGRLERVEAAIMARFRRGTISEGALDLELAALNRERASVRVQLLAAERALEHVGASHERVDAAAALLARMTSPRASGTPEARRAVLRAFVDPGGIVVTATGAAVDILVPRPVAAAPSRAARGGAAALALVPAPGSSSEHESHLRIRVVA